MQRSISGALIVCNYFTVTTVFNYIHTYTQYVVFPSEPVFNKIVVHVLRILISSTR